ncbi:hypothetical protein [Stutzerimonas nitrititolerans]|uniref:hypothetical protein n=1 Tax=Stutzerimonas nitrititolerans TaxID=2482751 RepID=UPI0028996583|nr:hypothetical protein [Stutzerimonas nitrititolerans]
MAYFYGSAVAMAGLRTALVDACTANGWSWDADSEVLSKGAMYLRLQVVGDYLVLLGRTASGSGDAPNAVRIGQLGSTPVTWPVTYEIFVFEDEVFMTINYSIDYYQWCMFGRSKVAGLPGTGMFVSASLSHQAASNGVQISTSSGGAGGLSKACPAAFWATSGSTSGTYRAHYNSWIHSDIDGQGWLLSQAIADGAVGAAAMSPLVTLLPNNWNSEAVLLPLRAWKTRASSKVSLVLELEYARVTRVDFFDPGQVIELGPDRWKVFPWYRKSTSERNGTTTGDHTGTLGWAIRYEGP